MTELHVFEVERVKLPQKFPHPYIILPHQYLKITGKTNRFSTHKAKTSSMYVQLFFLLFD